MIDHGVKVALDLDRSAGDRGERCVTVLLEIEICFLYIMYRIVPLNVVQAIPGHAAENLVKALGVEIGYVCKLLVAGSEENPLRILVGDAVIAIVSEGNMKRYVGYIAVCGT